MRSGKPWTLERSRHVNWPQIFKLINILACGLGFLCLIGFFLATQERFSWLLLILNYHLILKENTHSPPPIFTIILLPLPPVPPSSYFKSTHPPAPSHIHNHFAPPFSPPSPLVFPPLSLAISLPVAPLATSPTSHWKKTKKKNKLTFGERNWHKHEGGLGSNDIMARINSAVSEGC